MKKDDLLQDTASLTHFCETLSFEPEIPPFLAIDTEFIRERTYWPQLCLIQIADAKKAVAIDPLAPGMDLAPLVAVLQNPGIMKVFHSGRQDIEIFHLLTKQVPTPLFDTQIAAMVCGFGDCVSYESLVQSVLKKKVDKSSRLTDWSHRPLTPEQLSYALGDVIHLRKLYAWFHKKLQKNQRETWLHEEMALLSDPETYTMTPEKAWTRLKGGSFYSLKALSFTVLKELAALRESVAQEKNLPRRKILRDEVLFELALALPKTPEALKRSRGMTTSFPPDMSAEKIVERITRIQAWPPEKWEKPLVSNTSSTSADSGMMALLRLLLKICSEDYGVAQRLIGLSDDLEFLAKMEGDALAASPLLQGWRLDVFGKEALDLKAGRLALTAQKGKIHRVFLKNTASPVL